MIEHVSGDLLAADVEALVNPVNSAGAMGKGLARAFREAFPQILEPYRTACERGDLGPGRLLVVETALPSNPRWIVLFPTKRHWRSRSRLEDIDAGLAALAGEIRSRGIRSIAIPALGCGLGGLSWADVRPRIEVALGGLSGIRVLVHAPAGQ